MSERNTSDVTAELVHTTVDNHISVIELDSPSNRNALGLTLTTQLLAALHSAGADDDIRAVVLTHTGGTFCAGADLREALAGGMSPGQATAAGAQTIIELMQTMVKMPKPVVAVIDGHVRAGGFGLVGAADIVLAGPKSTFAVTEARLGLAPSMISLVLLPKMTSRAASRYFLTGETFTAHGGVEAGLVTQAFDDARHLQVAREITLDGIRRAAPHGLAVSKALTTAALRTQFESTANERAAESAALFDSDQAKEGMSAFFTKSRPSWDLTSTR